MGQAEMSVESRRFTWILVLSCPHCKYEQSYKVTLTVKAMKIMGSDISRMRVWFIPQGKPPRSAEGITWDEGNVDGRVEEGENEYWLQLRVQL